MVEVAKISSQQSNGHYGDFIDSTAERTSMWRWRFPPNACHKNITNPVSFSPVIPKPNALDQSAKKNQNPEVSPLRCDCSYNVKLVGLLNYEIHHRDADPSVDQSSSGFLGGKDRDDKSL